MIKIALNLKEDRVAAVVLARFPIIIDEFTLNYSIQAYCLNFIQYLLLIILTMYSNLFAYDKTEIQLDEGPLEA